MVVGILGMGRLGSSLARLLSNAGHTVSPWRRGDPWPSCDVAWLTVSDGAIADVARALPVGPMVLHASGACDLDVLSPHARCGSLHPLQSFPGADVAIPPTAGVPAAIAGTPEVLPVVRQLANDLGFRAVQVPGDRRLYHAAAVLAGNFSTVLLELGGQLLLQAGVPADEAQELLIPLVLASVQQARVVGPAAALTGPIARGDTDVVKEHLKAIALHTPDLLDVYGVLADHASRIASTLPSGSGE